jgi:hypothetical protein
MRTAFLILALAVAAPAQAEIAPRRTPEPVKKRDPFAGNNRVQGPGIHRDVADIRERIDDARESGQISRRDARRLDRQARGIGSLARVYRTHGLSESEARELQARANYLRDAVSIERMRGGTGTGKAEGKRKAR